MSRTRRHDPIVTRITIVGRAPTGKPGELLQGREQMWARPELRNQDFMAEGTVAGDGSSRSTRFALTKFRPPALPDTLISRLVLHDRLAAGSGQRLAGVGGAGGGGKRGVAGGWAGG